MKFSADCSQCFSYRQEKHFPFSSLFHNISIDSTWFCRERHNRPYEITMKIVSLSILSQMNILRMWNMHWKNIAMMMIALAQTKNFPSEYSFARWREQFNFVVVNKRMLIANISRALIALKIHITVNLMWYLIAALN
jgi:hypothetical protein